MLAISLSFFGSYEQDDSVLLLSHISGNHVIYIKNYSRQLRTQQENTNNKRERERET